jgi:hypothetical protein
LAASDDDLTERCAPPPDDAFSVTQIRVDFDIPAWISQDHQRELVELVERMTAALYNQPVNGVFWPAGIGSLPRFSKADAALLGKRADPDAPETGEPTYDSETFHIDCCARPFVNQAERARKLKKRQVRKAPIHRLPTVGDEYVENLLRRYCNAGEDLSHDDKELLLFALYLESKKHGGVVTKIELELEALAE